MTSHYLVVPVGHFSTESQGVQQLAECADNLGKEERERSETSGGRETREVSTGKSGN